MQAISRFDWWLSDRFLYRRMTDRKVYCTECGLFIGYVWRKGHQRFRHVDCAKARVEAV